MLNQLLLSLLERMMPDLILKQASLNSWWPTERRRRGEESLDARLHTAEQCQHQFLLLTLHCLRTAVLQRIWITRKIRHS